MRNNFILGLIVIVCLGLMVFLLLQPKAFPALIYFFIAFVGVGALDKLSDD
jgi:hypothetical protein